MKSGGVVVERVIKHTHKVVTHSLQISSYNDDGHAGRPWQSAVVTLQ